MCRHPELAARIVVSSFGKTYHITGWKIGYVVGPQALMTEFRKVHFQFNVFLLNTQASSASPNTCRTPRAIWGWSILPAEARFLPRAAAGLTLRTAALPRHLLQLARYDAISQQPDREFARWMTREVGVAGDPVSVFYHDGHDEHVVRFCFAEEGRDAGGRGRAAAAGLMRIGAILLACVGDVSVGPWRTPSEDFAPCVSNEPLADYIY